jgi:glycosyltransferase involved in cell wall biosynthesis
MFLIDEPEAPYSDPWNRTFEQRLKSFLQGPLRVAYFYETPDNSTFRYRVHNMIGALGRSEKGIAAAYFTGQEIDQLSAVVEKADLLVVARARYTDRLNRLITQMRNRGKRVYFDIDDLVFDPDYIHLVLQTLDQDLNHPEVWDHWFAYVGRVGAAMKLCDAVITTNDYLAEQVRRYANQPTYVIPNFMNQQQLDISRRIYAEKAKRDFIRSKDICLGYFSGTPSHNRDLDVAASGISRLLDEDPRVVLLVVGYMELKAPLQNYGSRVKAYPFHDFVNLQRLIGRVEVNLVPLQDNIFTNCKSELKYFEAGIVGTVTIASPVFTYTHAIRDGENGYLATSTEWYDKLRNAISSMDTYSTMAERVFRDSNTRYSWQNYTALIEKVLFPETFTFE